MGGENQSPAYYESFALPTGVTIPLNTFFTMGLPAQRLRCVFSQPLSDGQAAHLSELVSSCEGIHDLTLPVPADTAKANAFMRFLGLIAPYAVVILLSILNIANVLIHWLRFEFPRYTIYRICGASGGQIVFFLLFQVFLLVSVCYPCAYALEALVRVTGPMAGYLSVLPGITYVMVFWALLLLTQIFVLVRALPLIFSGKLANSCI